MKTAAEDQQQIATLRRDIEAQQKLVEQSLQKERQANELISKYKAETGELAAKIEQGAGMSIEQENQLQQLRTQKDQLEKDRDMLKQNTEMLTKICTGREKEVRKLENERNTSEDNIADMKQQVAE